MDCSFLVLRFLRFSTFFLWYPNRENRNLFLLPNEGVLFNQVENEENGIQL